MDIRIDTPSDERRTAEPLNDEQYIYAPFSDEEISFDDSVRMPRPSTSAMDGDIEKGEELEREYVEETYPEAVADTAADVEEVPDGDRVDDVPEEQGDTQQTVSREDYDALMERYNRLIADWDNYRRRSADETAKARANANRNMAETLIPTLDNFGYALNHAESMSSDSAAAEMSKGFEAIYRSLIDSLSREGLEVVSPEAGEPFDMTVHQAVERVQGSEFPPDTVVKTVQAGYKFNDYTIRPALVAVSV